MMYCMFHLIGMVSFCLASFHKSWIYFIWIIFWASLKGMLRIYFHRLLVKCHSFVMYRCTKEVKEDFFITLLMRSKPISLLAKKYTVSIENVYIMLYIALVKTFFFFNPKVLIFFLCLHKNICCGYSLEVPCRGASNEYPQHMFS